MSTLILKTLYKYCILLSTVNKLQSELFRECNCFAISFKLIVEVGLIQIRFFNVEFIKPKI